MPYNAATATIPPIRKHPIKDPGEQQSTSFRFGSWDAVKIISKVISSVCSIFLGFYFIVVAVYDVMSSLL